MKKESAAPVTVNHAAMMADAPAASTGGRAEQASPYKSAAEELDALRKNFRLASQHYAKRIDMEIIRLRERVAGAGEEQRNADDKKPARRGGTRQAGPGNSQFHDLRDMTTLLRTLEIKPTAGRRKDLKKIESLVEELRLLVERWG